MENEFIEMNDQKILMVVDGVEKEFDVLFTYDAQEIDKMFVGYTDNTVDELGRLQVYAAQCSKTNTQTFEPITDPKDMELIDSIIKEITNKYS